MKIIQHLIFLFLSACTTATNVNITQHGLNFTSASAFLAGEIVGNITLTPSQGQFVVERDVMVPEGSTLTIKPGVKILFRPDTGLQINGSLIAEGSPESKISLVSFPMPNASFNASRYYGDGIRLVGGDTYSKGKLEIFRNGQWGVICGRRWYERNTDVACRQLGFLKAKRFYAAHFDSTKPYFMRAVECQGSETSLYNCKHSTWNFCYYTRYQIGIECEHFPSYLQKELKWRGISFMMKSNASESILRHVNINDAFFALNATYKVPTMSSITVRNCFHGIQTSQLRNQFELTDSVITDNVMSGTRIAKSPHVNVLIHNSSFSRTAIGDGLSIEDELIPNDFCSWNQSWTPGYPLVLNAASDMYNSEVHCTKFIQVEQNIALTIHYRKVEGTSFWFDVFSKDSLGNWTLISRRNATDVGKIHTAITSNTSVLKIAFTSRQGSKSSVEFIITNSEVAASSYTIISNSAFLDNGLSGAKIAEFIGRLQMNNTKANQNNLNGLQINGLYGEFYQRNFVAMNNSKKGVLLERISGLVAVESIIIVHNNQDGIKICKATGVVSIKAAIVKGNAGHGIYIGSQFDTRLNFSNLEVSQNKENGLFFQKTSSGFLTLTKVTTNLNKKSGVYFSHCSTPIVVRTSHADMNGGHGFYLEVQSDYVEFHDITASQNKESGLRVADGVSRLHVEFGILRGNEKHGFDLNNHGSKIFLSNLSIIDNKERGINVYESSNGYRITLLSVKQSYISQNKFGINLLHSCAYKHDSQRNISIQFKNNVFADNILETIRFYQEHSCYYSTPPKPRRVFFDAENNTFINNHMSVIQMNCPGMFELKAKITSNTFSGNLGKVVTIKEGKNCGNRHTIPVIVEITANRFVNNSGQYMVNIDLQPYQIRFVVLQYNSFVMNKETQLLTRFYSRSTEDAVVVLKEGTFQIAQNVFENPHFTYQVAVALVAHNRVINASHNWWGTVDECKIKSQIFDGEDRLDLGRIEYFPFLKTNHSHNAISINATRLSCFLNNMEIGGRLDRHLELKTRSTPYIVVGDVIILPSGSLVINSNVTLNFPARSAFVVKGRLTLHGRKDETVKFTLDKVVDIIRLKNDWKGNVEVKINNTWKTLCVKTPLNFKPEMVCNHLNMEYRHHSLIYTSGKDDGFINNFRCDHHLALDMRSCNYNNLSYTLDCNGYGLRVECKRPYWSGVHLAMTNYFSKLLYLEIHEGGYNYRTDLKITSAALRVDFDHHVIESVLVKNSASVGVLVMYSNPFKKIPTIMNSLIEGSESSGMRLSFSYTTIDHVNISSSKGNGIYARTYWNNLDVDARSMSDPSFIRLVYSPYCNDKSIFIKEGETKYLVISPFKETPTHQALTCTQEIYTTNTSKIAVQIIYQEIKNYYWHHQSEVNSGIKHWKLRDLTWNDRPVLYGNHSSMHFRFVKQYYYTTGMVVHLLAFSTNDTNDPLTQNGKLLIRNSTIENTAENSIDLLCPHMDSVVIQNSTIQGSLKNGLKISSSLIKRLIIQSSTISRHKTGISLYSLNMDNYKGISGSILISNSVISECSQNGVWAWAPGSKTVTMQDSWITDNNGIAVHIRGRISETSIYIKGCRFHRNKLNCIAAYMYYDTGTATQFHVINNTFSNNGGRVINIERATSLTNWFIEDNIFFNNSEPSVFSIGNTFPQVSYTVKNNIFISNRCAGDAVIDLCFSARIVVIDQNTFLGNFGPSVILKTAVNSLPLRIQRNTFKNNICKGCPILKFLRIGKDIILDNNTFINNTGQMMILIQSVHGMNADTVNQNLSLINNTIQESHPSVLFSKIMTCVVDINGTLLFKDVKWKQNKMINPHYDYELCLHTPVLSQRTSLYASETWWGSNKQNDISKKVFSFDVNYNYGVFNFGSFLTWENDVMKTKMFHVDISFNEMFEKSMLKGRVYKSITLQRRKSPFKVLGDVTILPDVVVTIEPGVTIQLAPYTSILVLGTLLAKGENDRHITFKHIETSKTTETFPYDIRLLGGDFPWYGRLEIYHNSSWKPICKDNWIRQNAIVACRQLGYDAPCDWDISSTRFGKTENNITHSIEVTCSGNENYIAKCAKHLRGPLNNSCQHYIGLRCYGKEWGSIRFSRPALEDKNKSDTGSVLEYVDIMYAGKRNGSNTSAIEAIRRVPKINNIKLLNCSSGGITIVLPDTNCKIEMSQFKNTGGTGITIIENMKTITIQDSHISENTNGLLFTRWNDRLISSFLGQDGIFLCDNAIQAIFVVENEILYFETRHTKDYDPSINCKCQKRLRTEKGMGIVLRVLSVKGSQNLRVYAGGTDIINTETFRWKSSDLYIDFDEVYVYWQGIFSSQVTILVSAIKVEEMPCTFIRHYLCGWKSVLPKTIKGITATEQFNFDYYRRGGHQLVTGSRWNQGEYYNIVSPLIAPNTSACFLNLMYEFQNRRFSWLTIFLEENVNGTQNHIKLWSSDEEETIENLWMLASIKIPSRNKPFKLVILARRIRKWGTSLWLKNVFLENCTVENIDVNGNFFTKNRKHGILVQDGSTIQKFNIKIHRNKFTESGDDISTGAIRINTYDNPFYILNNDISKNLNGGVYITVENSHGNFVLKSMIKGNLFQGNKKETIFIDTKGSGMAFDIHIFGNTLNSNNGTVLARTLHSNIRLSQVICTLEENFVYDNYGKYNLEIVFNKRSIQNSLVIKVRNNTFYHNHGQIKDYGSTMYCNGPVEVKKNVIKNPSNLYELVTDRTSSFRAINATDNWWGFGLPKIIGSRILDLFDDSNLPRVNYHPFVLLRPETAVPLSCPTGWILFQESCFLYHGGPLSYHDAEEHCMMYGSHLLTSSQELDMDFLNTTFTEDNQSTGIAMTMWITISLEVPRCSVFTQDGNFSISPCESLQPFACSKTPVVRCPNNCFHNGKCVGTTCFCFKGWTGPDCSKFHCNNLRNCSGHGSCVGPNVCRCLPGISGRACTYSHCTQFENCRSCISNQNCGWCDNLAQCLPGHAADSYFGTCQNWFFYDCYTMGRENFCSREIMLINCEWQLCNYKEFPELASKEACQRCQDQEKCFRIKDAECCRTWNETRCPSGEVKIDYSDPTRIENTQIRGNVRIISPEKVTMYRCSASKPDGNITMVFVFNANLTLEPGNVMSSNQAGGVFHKVSDVKELEPFTFVTADPAGIGDFIQYADFQTRASLVSLEDEVTVEADPAMTLISELIYGNVSLTESLHIIPSDSFVYKCVGHMYEAGQKKTSSYYLVLNASTTPFRVETGDVLVSNQSHGFLSTIRSINKTSEFIFVETLLRRCNNYTDMSFKFHKDLNSEDISCPGGDNNPNLLIKETNNDTINLSVNDVIVDRPSQPFIGKVKSFHYSQGYLLVEVLPVTSVFNKTALTEIAITEARTHVRRKRATYTKRFGTDKRWGFNFKASNKNSISAFLNFKVGITITLQLEVSSIGINKLNPARVRMALYLNGNAATGMGVSFKVQQKFTFSKQKTLVKPKTLKRFFVCIAFIICLPSAIFFELDGAVTFKSELRAEVAASYSLGINNVGLNGECSTSGQCKSWLSKPKISTSHSLNIDVGGKISLSFTLTPRLALEIPSLPKLQKRVKEIAKTAWKKIRKRSRRKQPSRLKAALDRLVEKEIESKFELPTIKLSFEIPITIEGSTSLCSRSCHPKKELIIKIGTKTIKVAVSFGKKELLSYSFGCIGIIIKGNCYKASLFEFDKVCKEKFKNTPPAQPDSYCGNDNKTNKRKGKCGDFPVCLPGWSGEGCSKPDPPSGCVNGKTFGGANCTVTCKCFPGWIGTSCNVRAPSVITGDPHLSTFDGVQYDYFGIGELWGCQSLDNDFGLQFRFFAYERSSLTGGIALKAGNNTITLMTVRTLNSTVFPILRINGEVMDVNSLLGKEVKLDNGSILVSLYKKSSGKEKQSVVMLMSVEYKSGIAVSLDVRHSKAMGRQYINIGLTPIIDFTRKTSGLYGYMDGDPTNDLQGPDGNIFTDPTKFANSWRITTSSRQDFGWSWKNSNFHPDDIMDYSYIDPTFVPVYNLAGIDDQVKKRAIILCSSMGLSGELLKSCIYDIAVTNDTTLSEQETLQQGCENLCSGRGRCVNRTCKCIEGWSGKTCEIGQCANCSILHGKCTNGFCYCKTGWEGESCSDQATCFHQNNCTSPLHGNCKTSDICQCNDGFTGTECSIVPTCHGVGNCSFHGVCIDFDVCKCYKDWTGLNCSEFSCHDLSFCSGHGRCMNLYECKCDQGWTGISCGIPDCSRVNQCSQNGDCISSDTCRCKPGFQGISCSKPSDCSTLSNCSNRGICDMNGENVTCRCFSGFSGPTCNETSCEEVNNCTSHGDCIDANLCNCTIGYSGYNCSNFSCEVLNFCSGRGKCTDYDVCKCSGLWYGAACTIPNCTASKECSQKGDCIAPNTCECYRGYDGKYCDQLAPLNLHSPMFNSSEYNFTVKENNPSGTLLGMLVANDSDPGRNGKIFYSIVPNKYSRAFALNALSGALSAAIVFDYEDQIRNLKVEVIASDDGFPQRFSRVSVYLEVEDTNDNCPVFNDYQSNVHVTIPFVDTSNLVLFTIRAIDIDSGANGYVTHSIIPSNMDRYFAIDSLNATITTKHILQPDVYNFDVIATDQGNPPCASTKTVKLSVTSTLDTTDKPTSVKPSTTPSMRTTLARQTDELHTQKSKDDSTTNIPAPPAPPAPTDIVQVPEQPMFNVAKIVGFTVLGVIICMTVLGIFVRQLYIRHFKVFPRGQKGRECNEIPMESISDIHHPSHI